MKEIVYTMTKTTATAHRGKRRILKRKVEEKNR